MACQMEERKNRNRILYKGDESFIVLASRVLNSESMARLRLLLLAAVLALTAGTCRSFEFQEATLDAIHLGFKNGSLTSMALVQHYLGQISRLNPLLHAVIEVNPDALRQAARADAERRSSGDGRVGGLHGVPVLLKDNIGTRDVLNTTAGSLALLGSVVRRDAGVVTRLRRAGAVVLGKANMDEWANFRSAIGTGGWSARGGQGKVSAVVGFPLSLNCLLSPTDLAA
jgi:amidase